MSHIPSILSIQDMSSVGRCSLTVSIPIMSALGCQAIPLPTAVLSNHLEYPHYHMVDLTEQIEHFYRAWEANHISFDAIQSGFLASPDQIHLVKEAIHRFGKNKLIVVDPAMADHGRLYSIYTKDMVESMKQLIHMADIIKPNYTEACFLLDRPYTTTAPSVEDIHDMCQQLHGLGPSYIVLSSIPSPQESIGVVYHGPKDQLTWIRTPLIPVNAHGTGDVFTAILTALVLQGMMPEEAARRAATFTTEAVRVTKETTGSFRDGLALEIVLPQLVTSFSKPI